MNLPNFPWKPVAKDVAVVVAREAGVYLCRMAIDHAIDRIHSPGTGPQGGRTTPRRATASREETPNRSGHSERGRSRRTRPEKLRPPSAECGTKTGDSSEKPQTGREVMAMMPHWLAILLEVALEVIQIVLNHWPTR